ncbi:MAG: glutamate racemase, partial [Bacillota bacterium]|nr:glutamate racemase [Bacillota bacterium]
GSRSAESIESIVIAICDFLIGQGCKAIVMACNTSSALALAKVRGLYDIPIIGVLEPGARAAVNATRNGKIGVLATEGTVRSGAYSRAVQWLRPDCVVYSQSCPKLAPLVESGHFGGPEVMSALMEYVPPLLAHGVDTIVLGCTHYPFLAEPITKLLLPGTCLVDPALETVSEVSAILGAAPVEAPTKHSFYASGSVEDFIRVGRELIGFVPDAQKVYFREQQKGLTVELE